MPRGDRTGRDGLGPMTGRGLGYCAGFDSPGYMQGGAPFGAGRGWFAGRGRGFGRGLGLGYRFGSGYGRGYGLYPPVYDDRQEREALSDHASALERELKTVKDRLATLEKQGEEKK